MPRPKKNEKKSDFIARCIPIVLAEGTTDNPSQAAAICYSLWDKYKNAHSEALEWFKRLILNKDVEVEEIDTLSLLKMRRLLIKWWKKERKGEDIKNWSLEDIWNLNKRIVLELAKRGIKVEHEEIDKEFVPTEGKNEDLKPPRHGTDEDPENRIYLDEVLEELGSFKLRKPFVYLVGSLANHGFSDNDIDILIRKKRPSDPAEDLPIKFRIVRMLPKKFWNRVQFLYDDDVNGPFTDFIPLFDLKAEVQKPFKKERMNLFERLPEQLRISVMQRVIRSKAKRDADASKKEDKVKLFRFFLPPKPTLPVGPEERQTIEALADIVSDKLPVFVDKKFDGARHVIHKDGDKVVIYSEDGDINTDRFPETIKEILKLKGESFILDAEVETWKNGKHMPRESTVAYINSKSHPDEPGIVFNIFDILYLDGKDLHAESILVRQNELEKLGIKQSTNRKPDVRKKLNLVPKIKVSTRKSLISTVERLRKLPGSEGVVVKTLDSKYPLHGRDFGGWYKFHNNAIMNAIVLDRIETKTKGTYNYLYGVTSNKKIPQKYMKEVDGKEYLVVGKTFSTNQRFNEGDIIEIEFETANVIKDPKEDTYRLTLWAPRLLGGSEGGPDSLSTVMSKAKRQRILTLKEQVGSKTTVVEKLSSVYQDWPENDKAKDFAFHMHFRGKSVHGDLRFEFNDHLEGWTLDLQVQGEITEDVDTLKEARKFANDPSNFKMNNEPGMRNVKLLTQKKAKQPKIWLKVEGVVEPGQIGATKEHEGVFLMMDEGKFWFGARKTDFYEYFLKGKRGFIDGRWVVRKLARPKGFKKAGEEDFIWLTWKPKSQIPYVLTSRAKREKWVPPFGHSALPKKIKDQIPSKYKYWTKKSEKERLKTRDELLKNLDELNLKLESLFQETKEEVTFKLKKQIFRGPIIVRLGPSRERWMLEVRKSKNNVRRVILDSDPVGASSVSATVKTVKTDKFFDFEGEAKPGTHYNSTKDTPSFVRIEDEGKATIFEDSSDFIKIKLKGKKLKGTFIIVRDEPGSNLWTFKRAKEGPETDGQR